MDVLRRYFTRKGYSVHSPFAYNFIRGVLCEKEQYYGYQSLEQLPDKQQKVARLLFRISNYVQPASYACCGTLPSEALSRWVRKGCQKTHLAEAEAADLLILGTADKPPIPYPTPHVWFVFHINTTNKAYWRALTSQNSVAFDLGTVGVSFINYPYPAQYHKL